MTYEEARRRLNECKYLYLERYGRAELSLDLYLVITEARFQGHAGHIATGNELIDKVMGPGRSIESDGQCAHFTLVFKNCIAISIVNESFAQGELLDHGADQKFRTYDKSHFRDYIASVTFASDDHPGPFKHFELNCENHIVNIACQSDPIITVSTVGEVESLGAAPLAAHNSTI